MAEGASVAVQAAERARRARARVKEAWRQQHADLLAFQADEPELVVDACARLLGDGSLVGVTPTVVHGALSQRLQGLKNVMHRLTQVKGDDATKRLAAQEVEATVQTLAVVCELWPRDCGESFRGAIDSEAFLRCISSIARASVEFSLLPGGGLQPSWTQKLDAVTCGCLRVLVGLTEPALLSRDDLNGLNLSVPTSRTLERQFARRGSNATDAALQLRPLPPRVCPRMQSYPQRSAMEMFSECFAHFAYMYAVPLLGMVPDAFHAALHVLLVSFLPFPCHPSISHVVCPPCSSPLVLAFPSTKLPSRRGCALTSFCYHAKSRLNPSETCAG